MFNVQIVYSLIYMITPDQGVCRLSKKPFYIESYFIKPVTTSWTYSIEVSEDLIRSAPRHIYKYMYIYIAIIYLDM